MSQPYRPSLPAKMARAVARALKYNLEHNSEMDEEDRRLTQRFLIRIDRELFIRLSPDAVVEDPESPQPSGVSQEASDMLEAYIEKLRAEGRLDERISLSELNPNINDNPDREDENA